MSKQVKACRLITGEYLIATLVDTIQSPSGDTEYRMEDPAIFEVLPGKQPGELIPRFTALVPAGVPGDCVNIKHRDVMFWIEKIHDGVPKAYKDVISVVITPEEAKNG